MTPLAAKALAVLVSLHVYSEDVGDSQRKYAQYETIATAVADAIDTGNPPVVSGGEILAYTALLIATGYEESGYSLRVHEGHCRRNECDHGRARGPWQVQRNGMSAEGWADMIGIDNTYAQARVAEKRLEFGRLMCGDTRGAIARYFGLPCSARNSAQVVHRWRTYQRILKRMRDRE